MATKKTRITSVRNEHGIKVRKMCASCQHKSIDNDGTRICQLMQLKGQQKFRCPKWQSAACFAEAGNNKGRVKRREYLMFVFEVRMQEREKLDQRLMSADEVATLDSLRKRFEDETGLSAYIIY